MVLSIILIAIILIGVLIICKSYNFPEGGIIICVVFGFWFIIHIILMSLTSYEYEVFVEKRDAFEQTLKHSRESENMYETASIVKEVSDWNQNLAALKCKNKHFYLGQYVDNRIEKLEPIK